MVVLGVSLDASQKALYGRPRMHALSRIAPVLRKGVNAGARTFSNWGGAEIGEL
jgi:hypothetical protein